MSFQYRRIHMAYIAAGAIPFVVWRFLSTTVWPDASIAAYLLTAWLFLTLLIGYPGPRRRWYWKPVMLMVALHILLLLALIIGARAVVESGVRPPTAMFFSLVIAALAGESWIALRLIERFYR